MVINLFRAIFESGGGVGAAEGGVLAPQNHGVEPAGKKTLHGEN